ncbi:hypothetical protein R1sor_022519 [Riccia sorocarpa]|uniref:Phosphate transporter PHO1 n=1 Tax=Riccia sorocarpa TaxID=122646 RepID=A0ABD3GK50_9MARC
MGELGAQGSSSKVQMRLNFPLDTPGRTIKSVTQSLVEEVLKHGGSDGSTLPGKEGNISVTKKNVRVAEKMLKAAFEEFYRGLGLLKNYCSLNAISFAKIVKKFDKVSGFRTLPIYIKAVEMSHFTTSETTISLLENVETLFAKTFAKNDESRARNHLRPANRKASHNVTFLLGLFTGGSIALFTIYVIVLHAKLGHYMSGDAAFGTLDEAQQKAIYLRTIFPVFAVPALIILHIFMYGFNVYFWCKWRINYPFMFDMRQGTELRHREVLMAASVLLCILLAAMLGHLFLHDVSDSHYVDFVPLSVFILLVGLLFFPFNAFKRSSRIFLIIAFIRFAFAPLYKVLLKDFFLGDQLTTQVPMLRNLLFTFCYYSGGFFKSNNADGCRNNETFLSFTIIVSLVPYWWRFLQCIRRYVEEHDVHQLQNAGKYLSTAVAVCLRILYMRYSNITWFFLHVVVSVIATVYQTYWDLCVDWGLLRKHSKNKWLRDSLIMPKAKHWYFLCMVANVLLRLAWVQSILRFRFGLRDYQVADFAFASLEVIRRGIWNFFRLENEHLNNVGKYRATKIVPLPFEKLATDEL